MTNRLMEMKSSSIAPESDQSAFNGGAMGCSHGLQQRGKSDSNIIGRPIRRRSRASKKSSATTLLNANPTNFRSLVQQFTGCNNSSSSALLLGGRASHKGPINLNFAQYNNNNNNNNNNNSYFSEKSDIMQQRQHEHLNDDEYCRIDVHEQRSVSSVANYSIGSVAAAASTTSTDPSTCASSQDANYRVHEQLALEDFDKLLQHLSEPVHYPAFSGFGTCNSEDGFWGY